MDEKIIMRIKKLLALSGSENEGESESAILKAQELLAKHKLSMTDIDVHIEVNDKVVRKDTVTTFTSAKWKGILADLIAENLGCKTVFEKYYKKRVTFLGKEDNVEICLITYQYALDCINSKVKKLQYEKYKEGLSTKGLANDYALGFMRGLNTKFKAQKTEHSDWGLVLTKDADVLEALKRLNAGHMNMDTKFNGHKVAYREGQYDGENFETSDKISNEGAKSLFIE